MMTNNFNFERFGLVFKRDVIENWRKDLRTYIGMFLGFFLTMLIFHPENVIFSHVETGERSELTTAFMVPLALVAVLYVFLGLSGMFSNLSHKQSRISFFMLPASNLEKYLVRLLRSSILTWIVIFICLVLADLASWAIHFAFGANPSLLLPRFFPALQEFRVFYVAIANQAIDANTPVVLFYINHITSALAWMGTYILGAAVFRKQPFILTSLCVFAVTTMMTLGMFFVGAHFFTEEQLKNGILNMERNMTFYFYFTLIFNTLWTVFCFWITYRMFKNANVIAQRTIGL